jgi:hypothetical protein
MAPFAWSGVLSRGFYNRISADWAYYTMLAEYFSHNPALIPIIVSRKKQLSVGRSYRLHQLPRRIRSAVWI